MSWALAEIWRHPIKGIGAEPLETVDLTAGAPLPLDRAWAVLEQGGDTSAGWRSCTNFLRGAKGPSLMAVTAQTDGDTLTLTHPDRPALSVAPAAQDAAARLLDWLAPIYPENRRPAEALVTAPPEGMADAPFASVSVLNMASLRALGQKAGQTLDPRRFRGNLWLDGLAPWEEFDLVGKSLTVGTATLDIVEPIGRCRATEANPDTGRRDVPMLKVLEDGWGHTEFGVYAKVAAGGTIARGDRVSLT